MPYIPHTAADQEEMLARIQATSIDSLFDEIPAALRYGEFSTIPDGMNEMQLLQHAAQLAQKAQQGICFMGAGSYEHHIPAAVWDIASRGEFLTAYTPYQAEASQGTLQLLYEFQTMIAELTGMEVANASLYDGASALTEAVLMAQRLCRDRKAHRILVAGTLHPYYRETLETILRNQQIEILTLPFDSQSGISDMHHLAHYTVDDLTALVMVQPNFFGHLEQVDEMTRWAQEKQILTIACVNPIALGLISPPGEWGLHGVDIVCGEGQPLGSPLASGGPYFGFLSTKMQHVRQMPGRLIGRTVDKSGRPGFTLTLQAREQHIRRAKATSNICTNQGLLVTAAAIHMSLLGAQGLQQVAQQCFHNTHALAATLTQIPGVRQVFQSPFFHETLLQLERPVDDVLMQLQADGILGGYPVAPHFPSLPNTLLVCATEMRTEEDINQYAASLQRAMTTGD